MSVAAVLGPIGPLADHALIYAGLGLEIFPVNPRDKTPLTSQYQATTDTDQVIAWWRHWPDALIGHRLDDDTLVLDIDPKSGGDATWRALKAAAGIQEVTTRAHLSGRGDGGGHTWWRMPGDKVSVSRVDAWAQERGLGKPILDRTGRQVRWSGGIDLLHRGHRYTILPPSPHPDTGLPYRWPGDGRDVGTLIEPLPQFLVDLIVDDEPPVPPKPRQPSDPDSIADWYTANHTWGGLLNDWSLVAGDGESDGARWRHPTATSKFSATIRHGCLFVYSPNTVFEPTVPGRPRGYTKFAAYAELEHGGDQKAAAKTARAFKSGPAPSRMEDWSWVPDLGAAATHQESPDDQESAPKASLTLPDEFWAARPVLGHVRTAARSRMCAPDAMFAAVLCRVVQHVDYRFVLPAVIGGVGTLNMFAVIVGSSGAGKGAASSASAELVQPAPPAGYRVTEVPAGSGEGLVHAFYERVTEKDGKRSVTVMRRRYEGALVRCDEGQALTALAGRQGQTTMETLRQAFSGELLGGSYSTGEKRVTLGPHDYRMAMLMAVQPIHARGLLEDWAGGTPQRFWWATAIDPDAPELDDIPEWPGPIRWEPPSWEAGDMTTYRGYNRGLIAVDPVIVREMRERQRAITSGKASNGRYGGHRNYVRLKIAAALGMLEGRPAVYEDDWRLAGMVLGTSDSVRSAIVDVIQGEAAAAEEGRNVSAARRAQAEQAAVRGYDDNVVRVAKIIGRRAHKVAAVDGSPIPVREVRHAVKSKDRDWFDAGLAHAEAQGWIVVEDSHVTTGESRPA